ncbi:hypothetical protein PU02_0485 [Bartonella ancashensis]|uniref:Uncharacterized protein n=1 Tax=Bartonella ancashensis TaxID=1318743 RepID=A0A0M4M2Y4_9HYPH|nr:hypothetical protein PU02_0485 [Bartonella ancashensis]
MQLNFGFLTNILKHSKKPIMINLKVSVLYNQGHHYFSETLAKVR